MPALRRSGAILAALLLMIASRPLLAAHAAEELVHDTTEKVLARLKQDQEKLQADNNLIYPLVEDLVLPHFDFRRMSIWVLGKNWRKADEAQQARFTEEFRTLLVRTYAKALLEYTDQKLVYLPFNAGEGDTKVTVKTEIEQPGGYNIPLNYSMYRNEAGEWKVYDISVDGVSLVMNYRTSFANEVRQGGIPGLIKSLVSMNQKGKTSE